MRLNKKVYFLTLGLIIIGFVIYNLWFISLDEYISKVYDRPIREIDYNYIGRIDIDRNRFKDIKDIVKCKNLQDLTIRNCRLEDLEIIQKIENLKSLSINHSNLREIPDISQLKSLQVLDLSFNKIEILNKDLSENKNLFVVRIRDNRISEIKLLKSDTIRELNLVDNKITDISGLEGSPALENLFLDGSPVNKAEAILKMKNLKVVTLSGRYLPPDLIEAFDKMDEVMMN